MRRRRRIRRRKRMGLGAKRRMATGQEGAVAEGYDEGKVGAQVFAKEPYHQQQFPCWLRFQPPTNCCFL